jgi:hypothetical protein
MPTADFGCVTALSYLFTFSTTLVTELIRSRHCAFQSGSHLGWARVGAELTSAFAM